MSNTILVLKKTDSALSRTLKIVKKSQASQKRCLFLYVKIKNLKQFLTLSENETALPLIDPKPKHKFCFSKLYCRTKYLEAH